MHGLMNIKKNIKPEKYSEAGQDRFLPHVFQFINR